MDLLVAKDLIKTFNEYDVKTNVINGISLSIKDGEFISIMGPSGSGKTTLLYLLSGLEKKTAGKIYLFGKEIDSYSDNEISELRKRKIGFVFQSYNLIDNLTVYENLLLALSISKNKNGDILGTLNEVEILKYKDYYPSQISGGTKQRVAIARALLNNPEIIFADEPVGSLDSKSGENIMEIFKRINQQQKRTIIQVTHLLENTKYSTRVINIKDGKII